MSNIFQAVSIIPIKEGDAFSCARGCLECKFAHQQPVDLHLEENFRFFSDVKAFFAQNQIQAPYLSGNHFGDLFICLAQYEQGSTMLLDSGLLEAGKNQMLDAFADMETYTEEAGAKVARFLGNWDYSISLSLTFSLRIDKGYSYVEITLQNIAKFLKSISDILDEVNLKLAIQLHGLHKNTLTDKEKTSLYLMLHKIHSIHPQISMGIPWELGSSNFRLFQKDISEVFSFTPLDICPYAKDTKLLVNERSFLFFEFDIYKDAIRPHGKYCNAIRNMSIGDIYTEFSVLKERAGLLKTAVREISREYQKSKSEENVCEYCKKRFSAFFPAQSLRLD